MELIVAWVMVVVFVLTIVFVLFKGVQAGIEEAIILSFLLGLCVLVPGMLWAIMTVVNSFGGI